MSKIMLMGDVHGSTFWVQKALQQCNLEGVDTVLQVGDFGFWEHTKGGKNFLDQVDSAAKHFGVTLYWLDGNHENHPLLREKYTEVNDEGFIPVRPRILYIPRGTAWEWEGQRMLALGGAYSIDKEFRIPGKSWWPEEMVTDADMSKAIATGDCDVFFSHDCPNEFMGAANFDLIHSDESMFNRLQVAKVAAATHPRLWVHGHMHYRVDYEFRHGYGYCKVVSLSQESTRGNWAWLDLSDLAVQDFRYERD